MKKIYALTVVCLCFAVSGLAQTYYWVGPSNGLWNSSANWSATSGGSGGAGIPNGVGANVIFNTDAALYLNVDVNVNTLKITNSSVVTVTARGAGRSLTANSTSSLSQGLQIDAGSRLEDSTEAGSTFDFVFVDNGKGVINGQWYLTGNSIDDYSGFMLPEGAGQTTNLSVNNNGSITVTENSFITFPLDATIPYLRFNAGSFLYLTGNGSYIPKATYDAASTVSITGIRDVGIIIDEPYNLGNLIYNCPGQSVDNTELSLPSGLHINGNLQIQNTNDLNLILLNNTGSGSLPVTVEIEGNLEVSGNSAVVVSKMNNFDKTYNLIVDGDLKAGGSAFDIQTVNFIGVLPTNVIIKGNLQHTAGTFGATATSTNESQSLYVVEMNGGAGQTISSVTGSIDNDANQVTLRINNAAGVTLLTPLKVGRIDFNSTNHGILNTGTSSVLTVQNTSGNSIVVNSPGSQGYVNGPLRRASASTTAMIFPTGAGGVYRQLTVTPSSNDVTTYQANLVSDVHPGTITSPLTGIANYYWEINRFSGSADATVQMALNGVVSNAQFADDLVAAKYDGTSWTSAKGTTGNSLPGNSTSGNLISELQNTFDLFTIGYISASSLPINLLSFTGKRTGNSAALLWKITENSTPVKFEVMRAADGKNFISAGSVSVTKGQLNYTFTDNSLAAGNNYYRLKMFDKDGTVSFSNIIVIMNGSNGVLISSMIPTIVKDRARLNISSSVKGSMQLVVTDINGRIIQNQIVAISAGNQEVWLNAGNLATGMFQVTGYINGEKTTTIRFIKQ